MPPPEHADPRRRRQARGRALLNNTVLASPRILIPLVENHQQADGSILIPEPLRPYLGGADRIG